MAKSTTNSPSSIGFFNERTGPFPIAPAAARPPVAGLETSDSWGNPLLEPGKIIRKGGENMGTTEERSF